MVVGTPTVSGVVLLVPQHLSFFCKELVPNLAEMTTKFEELLVVASGLSRREMLRVESSLNLLAMYKNKRVVRAPLGPVGANRNHGLDHAISDLVSFLDSDDLYSPDYCAFLKKAYEQEPYQVLLHSFVTLVEGETESPIFDSLAASLSGAFYRNEDFLARPMDNWQCDPILLESTSLQFVDAEKQELVHQGHMTVARGLPFRFHENLLAQNEDGVYLQQCLSAGIQVRFSAARLSAYRLYSSANPLRYRILRRVSRVLRPRQKARQLF